MHGVFAIAGRVLIGLLAVVGLVCVATAVSLVVLGPARLPATSDPVSYPAGAYALGRSAQPLPESFGEARDNRPAGQPLRVLAISSGGQGGAYGAGILAASVAAPDWPDFDIYTGVSAGGALATLAFAGKADRDSLKAAVSAVAGAVADGARTPHVFDLVAATFGFGVATSRRTEDVIRTVIDADVVAAVAEKHQTGRRLYIVSTDLTTGRPVVWDLGQIAVEGGPDSVQLLQDALLASLSIPVVFPPRIFAADGDETLHVDGSVMRPFFLPRAFVNRSPDRTPLSIHFLLNGKLQHPIPTERLARDIGSVGARLLHAIHHAEWTSFLERLLLDMLLFDWEVQVASMPEDFDAAYPPSKLNAADIREYFEAAYTHSTDAIETAGSTSTLWPRLTPSLIGLDFGCPTDEVRSC